MKPHRIGVHAHAAARTTEGRRGAQSGFQFRVAGGEAYEEELSVAESMKKRRPTIESDVVGDLLGAQLLVKPSFRHSLKVYALVSASDKHGAR
jgi:hypothetical protein